MLYDGRFVGDFYISPLRPLPEVLFRIFSASFFRDFGVRCDVRHISDLIPGAMPPCSYVQR